MIVHSIHQTWLTYLEICTICVDVSTEIKSNADKIKTFEVLIFLEIPTFFRGLFQLLLYFQPGGLRDTFPLKQSLKCILNHLILHNFAKSPGNVNVKWKVVLGQRGTTLWERQIRINVPKLNYFLIACRSRFSWTSRPTRHAGGDIRRHTWMSRQQL